MFHYNKVSCAQMIIKRLAYGQGMIVSQVLLPAYNIVVKFWFHFICIEMCVKGGSFMRNQSK